MKKVLLRIFVVFCLTTSVLLVAPFHIHAAGGSLTAPFIGYNYSITQYVYDREYIYDLNYSSSTSGTGSFQITSGSVTLSGPVQYGNWELYSSANSGGGLNNIKGTMTLPTTSVSADLTETSHLDQYYIIEYEILLDDVYQGVVNITVNGSTNDRYVNSDTITGSFRSSSTSFNPNSSGSNVALTINSFNLVRQVEPIIYNYPMESYPFIFQFMYRNLPTYSINPLYEYELPMFNVMQNEEMFTVYIPTNAEIDMVIILNRQSSATTLFNTLVPDDSTGLSVSYTHVITSDILTPSTDWNYRFCHYVIKNTGTARNVTFTSGVDNLHIMPIYLSRTTYRSISTEFALRFDLSNSFLDNVNIIANGTSSTNESVADLQDEQSEFGQSASDLYSYENTFNESLNDSLDDINVNFNIGNTFGSKFLASATWVRQQFDALTSSSPFGSVLSFSLILGIALLVIGKAIK